MTATIKPRRVAALDAVPWLTVFLVCLFGIPSRLIVGPLGAAGTPAAIVGLLGLIWWIAQRLGTSQSYSSVSQPIRRAALVFLACVMASYVAAMERPISGSESRSADMGVLSLFAMIGVLSLATDAVPSLQRLDVLLRRLVFAGGALATLGVLQFVTGQSFVNALQIPGLQSNSNLAAVIARNGFARPAGTATHPIEFGVVLTMILPMALHYAFQDTHRARWRRWYPVLAIALAVPISLSRSAVLCTVTVLICLLPTWTKARRRTSYVFLIFLGGVLYVTVPGILGTITRLFTGISDDGSALSRTDSYNLAFRFIFRAPVIGRGFGTFLPSYRILDNQYLGVTIELGLVGLAALLVLFLASISTAWQIRQRSADPTIRALAQALVAALAACALSFATFDAFGFPMVPGLLFLLLGIAGGLRGLTVDPRPPAGG